MMKIKHIDYIDDNKASGKLHNIYKHIKKHFGKIAEPFVLHSLSTEYVAGFWAFMYETILVETNVKRSLKEAIATCISIINKCPYCVDAHSIMILGTEKELLKKITAIQNNKIKLKTKDDKIIYWLLNNPNFKSKHKEISISQDEAPEIIGTIVLFHYINRMVTIFAGITPLPINKFKKLLRLFAANILFKKAINTTKIKGDALLFLTESDTNENIFLWANKNTNIKKSFNFLWNELSKNIDKIIPTEIIEALENLLNQQEEIKTVLGNQKLNKFLNSVDKEHKVIAEFCYKVMFEPYKITEIDINTLRQNNISEIGILQLAAFSSIIYAKKTGDILYENYKH